MKLYDYQDKENFYSQLNAVVDKIPMGDIKICMGDFNAKIGSDNSSYEPVMGRHDLEEMTANGELLAEFCGNNDMVLRASLFPIVRFTRSRVSTVKALLKINFLMCGINVALILHPTIIFSSTRCVCALRGFVDRRKHSDVDLTNVAWKMPQMYKSRPTSRMPSSLPAKIICVSYTLGENSGSPMKPREAKALSRQRYSALEREVKRSCRRDKRTCANSLADEGEKAAATGDIRLLYDISRRLSGAKMNTTIRPAKTLV